MFTFALRQILVPGKTLRQVTFSAFVFLTSFKSGVTSCLLLFIVSGVVSYFSTPSMAFGPFICNGSLTSALVGMLTGNFPEVWNKQGKFQPNIDTFYIILPFDVSPLHGNCLHRLHLTLQIVQSKLFIFLPAIQNWKKVIIATTMRRRMRSPHAEIILCLRSQCFT